MPLLKIAKLVTEGSERLIRVRNITAGGLMAEIAEPPPVGEPVSVEMSSQRIPSSVTWTREGLIGIKFDQTVDLGELLAGRKPRHGFRPRPPRLEVDCKASVRLGKVYYTVDIHDISLGGMKVEPIEDYCVGREVVVVVESLKPIKGEVRWYSDRRAGIVFKKPLEFEELAEWVGKRLEVASLKASIKRN
ncbi:MAG: PilZ domain-containing protein [Sphingomonas sp.]|nr:PilZ domain-containing protein [Sphingomonas sp.]